MGLARSLHFRLHANWEETEGISETTTYTRKGRTNNNALQVNVLINTSDARPEIDPERVIVAWVKRIGGKAILVSSLEPGFGKTASATFSASGFAYCQAWFSTDGVDTIHATFICDRPPSADELREVSEMVRSMRLGEATPSKSRGWWPS